MDDRVQKFLESEAGVSLDVLPIEGNLVLESSNLTDDRGNCLAARRFVGSNGVLVTVGPGRADALTHAVRRMTPGEIFSPLGRAELCRALNVSDEPPRYYLYGFRYVLTSLDDFCSAQTTHTATPLGKGDIPEEQLEMRMSQRREQLTEDYVWAFACHRDDPAFEATNLAPFGAQCAAVAVAMWKDGPVADIGIETDESCRGRGFGLAAASATTKWILEQDEVAVYGAYYNNIPSLRIARRLGFNFLQQRTGIGVYHR